MRTDEFKEIGHCGGQVIFRVVTGQDGRRAYQVTWKHARPVPAALFAIYALPQGIPVAPIELGGIGQPWNEPPVPGCFPVFIASDSEGMFGQQCPGCDGYWRCRGTGPVCPYCGVQAEKHQFLTAAQRVYVQQYCDCLRGALESEQDGEHVIDMDAVAEAAGQVSNKPAFYYAEESQQNKFTCDACGGVNDILGTYGYCSTCGTRNDLNHFIGDVIPRIRNRIIAGGSYESCAKEVVAAFDSFAGQYAKQLVHRIPMTPARKTRIEKMRFHSLRATANEFKTVFDIDIVKNFKPEDITFATLMFHRRHVYEHNGGEADEKYIADSGDTSVRPKQRLYETSDSAHQLAGLVVKLASNLREGFHDIFRPDEEPIKLHTEYKERMAAATKRRGAPAF